MDTFTTKLSDLILSQARKQNLLVGRANQRLDSQVDRVRLSEEDMTEAAADRAQALKDTPMQQEEADLMLALSAGRTALHYGMRHWCITHRAWVDFGHLRECSLIRQQKEALEASMACLSVEGACTYDVCSRMRDPQKADERINIS